MTSDTAAAEYIGLLESLRTGSEWIKLLVAVMGDVGPAAQTLGGLLRVTNRETFSPVSDIAGAARLPIPTVRKHIAVLHERGWVNHRGREKTRRGWLRRTATIALTKQTKDHLEPYGFLPWWACCRGKAHLPWCARAILSIVLARLAALKHGAMCDGFATTEEEVMDQIENMGVEERFRFSLAYLTGQTGLSRETVVVAKRRLHNLGMVRWAGTRPTTGQNTGTDILSPNWEFRVRVTPASEGHIYVAFDRGSENGQ